VTSGSICPDRLCREYSVTHMCSKRGLPKASIYTLECLSSVPECMTQLGERERDANMPPGYVLIK
jgi:hypothetical protein